ncbi:ATP-binding cassette domain-containing protein [Microbacterium lacticum]
MGIEYAVEGRAVVRNRGRFVLGPVNVLLPRGEVMGLVGPNGSGKTTLLKAILGLARPDAGSLEVLGTTPERARAHVGAALDAPYLVPEWTIRDACLAVRRFYPNWDQEFADFLAHQFQLDPSAKVKELSSGEASKLRILLALAHQPELVVLDEPTSGLDPLAREQIMQTIRAYLADHDSSVLFSTHIPVDLAGIADQLLAVRQGRVAYAGEMDLLTERYAAVRGSNDDLEPIGDRLIGLRSTATNFDAVIPADRIGGLPASVVVEEASIDDIVKALAVPIDTVAGA